jgi:integrase
MLSDTAVRRANPKEKPYKLTDEKGLYLLVTPSGGKLWRINYRFEGRQKTLALGSFPDVSLKRAREKRDEARTLLAEGIDPSLHKKATKAAESDTFEAVAREWHLKFSSGWTPRHAERILRRFERDIFPWLGKLPIREINAPELLAVLRRIEDRGAMETAHRALQYCGQIFRYAIATGRADRDISADLKGALAPVKRKHFAAVTEPGKIAELLRVIDSYEGTFIVKCALRLAPLVFVRPGELRTAEWSHIDLDAAEWRYFVTKTETPHIVPLATQAVEILRALYALTGSGRYVFPCARVLDGSRPMSENAILAALRRMGYTKEEMTGHGFRALARTVLDEVLGFRPDFIEHQLAHAVRDPNGRAYNRTKHLEERRKMMQAWADYLDTLREGAQIIPLRVKG